MFFLLLTTGKCPDFSSKMSSFVVRLENVLTSRMKYPSLLLLTQPENVPVSRFVATDSAVKYCDVAPTISSFVAAKMT